MIIKTKLQNKIVSKASDYPTDEKKLGLLHIIAGSLLMLTTLFNAGNVLALRYDQASTVAIEHNRGSVAIKVPSRAGIVPSYGSNIDVTQFTLFNDMDFSWSIAWINGQGIVSKGGPVIQPGQSWRVENGAKTWESHWFAISNQNGVLCSVSLRQGAVVSFSQLSACYQSSRHYPAVIKQPSQPHKYQPIAQYPLTSDANDALGKSNAMTLKGVQFRNGALHSDGIYQANTASVYPKNWDLTRFSISANFFVNDMEKSRPVFITGHRWLGYYLDKNGTISIKYNNSNMITSNTRYKINTWHLANITYENGIAYYYLDGIQIGHKKIKFNFVNKNPRPSIGITDYSNGATFKGWIKDLIVYR